MKPLTSIAVCVLVLLVFTGARAQESLDATINNLQRQIQVREAIDRDPKTSPALRAANQRTLADKRAQLSDAVEMRIAQLQKYLSTLGASAAAEERQYVETSLRNLRRITDRTTVPAANNQATGQRSVSTMSPSSSVRPRLVGQSVTNSARESGNAVSESGFTSSAVVLDAANVGENVVRGRSIAGVTEVLIEIRTRQSDNARNAQFSHAPQDAPVVYRVTRLAAPGSTASTWPFTVRLARPLTVNQELRAIPNGQLANATQWTEVRSEVRTQRDARSATAPEPIVPRATVISTRMTAPPDDPVAAAHFTEAPTCGEDTVYLKGDPNKKYQITLNGADVSNVDGTKPQQAAADGLLVVDLPRKLGYKDIVQAFVIADDGSKGAYVYSRVDNCSGELKGHPVGFVFGGVVLSQQANEFSQADPFFGFSAGYDSDVHGLRYHRRVTTRRGREKWEPCDESDSGCELGPSSASNWRWHVRFQGIFTADGRAASGQTAPAAPTSTAPTTFSFIASRKAFDVETHAWIDLFARNIFTIGPYGAVGASTVLSKNELANSTVTNGNNQPVTQLQSDNDLKHYWEVGPLMNIRMLNKKVFLQSIFAYGQYEALRGLDDKPTTLAASAPWHVNDTSRRFIGRLRIFPEGLKMSFGGQVEATPMFGVEVNAGTGPDQTKFFTGYAIRIGGIGQPTPDSKPQGSDNKGTDASTSKP